MSICLYYAYSNLCNDYLVYSLQMVIQDSPWDKSRKLYGGQLDNLLILRRSVLSCKGWYTCYLGKPHGLCNISYCGKLEINCII